MLQIHKNINNIIKNKGLTKKEFANRLISLNPTVSRIGETPSISTIYSYLNGRINIPVELIPYVAEVLDVTEQELFDTTTKSRKKCFKYFVENAQKSELEYFNNFINSQINHGVNINYGKIIMKNGYQNSKIEELSSLLEHAPEKFIDKVIIKLKEYKKISEEF
jgi:transcriptional regulator with XRE-family HTH domain